MGKEERLEVVLPLVKKHEAAAIAICNDETDISEDPDVRFAVAQKIVARAMGNACGDGHAPRLPGRVCSRPFVATAGFCRQPCRVVAQKDIGLTHFGEK